MEVRGVEVGFEDGVVLAELVLSAGVEGEGEQEAAVKRGGFE